MPSERPQRLHLIIATDRLRASNEQLQAGFLARRLRALVEAHRGQDAILLVG